MQLINFSLQLHTIVLEFRCPLYTINGCRQSLYSTSFSSSSSIALDIEFFPCDCWSCDSCDGSCDSCDGSCDSCDGSCDSCDGSCDSCDGSCDSFDGSCDSCDCWSCDPGCSSHDFTSSLSVFYVNWCGCRKAWRWRYSFPGPLQCSHEHKAITCGLVSSQPHMRKHCWTIS